MPLSNILTYDQATPHRPTLDELGGGAFQNDPIRPPLDGHPSAEMFNQATKQIVALAGVAPSLKIQVEFFAGAPVITQLLGLGTLLTAANFIAMGGTITDNGNGDTSITCPPTLIPTQLMRPSGLTVVGDVEIDRARVFPITNGWRVKTKLGTVGTDAPVVFQVN